MLVKVSDLHVTGKRASSILVDSIKMVGMIQPILIAEMPEALGIDKPYIVLNGNQRVDVAKELQMDTIQATIIMGANKATPFIGDDNE